MRDTVPFSAGLPITTWFKVDQLADALDLKRSFVFDRLIRHGLDRWTEGQPLPDQPERGGAYRAYYNVRLSKTTLMDLQLYHKQTKEAISSFCSRVVELALQSWEFEGMSTVSETPTTPVYLRGLTYHPREILEKVGDESPALEPGKPPAPELRFAEDSPPEVKERKVISLADSVARVPTTEDLRKREARKKKLEPSIELDDNGDPVVEGG